MRLARRGFLKSTLAAVAAPAVARVAMVGRARADAPITLKLHHSFSSVSSAHNKFLAPWARKVESDSGGRLRIDIFPSMQLGGAPAQLYDQARDGVADIVWAQPSSTPRRFPKIEVFELPFVPSRRALVNSKALQAYAAANLGDEVRDVHPICFGCQDHGLVHANREVTSLGDLKDLKLRIPTRIAEEALHALGASAVGMPILQLPMAIAQHVVDGCVVPWESMPALKLQDMLKFHTETGGSPALTTTTFIVAMNKRTYGRLSADLKKVIDDNSGESAAAMAGAMWDDEAATVADMVRQRGDTITTLTAEEEERWRKATEPVIAAWIKTAKEHRIDGAKLLANARALLAKYEKEPEPARLRRSAQSPVEPVPKSPQPQPTQAAAPKSAEPTPAPPPMAANPAPAQARPAQAPAGPAMQRAPKRPVIDFPL
jgi:TRAP-type C4-dicarboxylate transport system substrate-binding protein